MNRRCRIPGFVDLQVNGYGGVDFSSTDLTTDGLIDVARQLAAAGTCAFLPTLITSPDVVYERNLPLLAAAMNRPELHGRVLGIHLEGPFISPQPGAVGAHDPRWVRAPDVRLLKRWQKLAKGKIRLLTIAAELDGAAELCRAANALGITVSLGHQLARTADLDRLAAAGAKALTHLGNGLPNLMPRHDNPLVAGLACDALTAMMISDGHHLPPEIIKLAVRSKGVARLIAVSDSSPIAGLPPGNYETLGNHVVLEPTGRLHNPEKGCLVGSSANLLQCMNHLVSFGWLSCAELLKIGYHNPLHLLNFDDAAIFSTTELTFDTTARQFFIASRKF